MNSMKQNGMVLVFGLIFLMLLTIMGITALSSSTISEKLTQNLRETSTAFEAAESGLGDAESWVSTQSAAPAAVTSCTSGPCVFQVNALGSFYQQPLSWWQTNGTVFGSSLGNVATQPYYVIEQYSFIPYDLSPEAQSKGRGYYFYRITSRGTGGTNAAQAVVQSIYATQYN